MTRGEKVAIHQIVISHPRNQLFILIQRIGGIRKRIAWLKTHPEYGHMDGLWWWQLQPADLQALIRKQATA